MKGPPPMKTEASAYHPAEDAQQKKKAHGPKNMYVSPTTGNPIVQIGFWGPDDTTSSNSGEESVVATPWYNRLAACWTSGGGSANRPSFSHCEMRFANGFVCSIHEYMSANEGSNTDLPGRVHCRPRELDRKRYHFIEFPVTVEQHDAMFATALVYQERKVPFNQAGMRLNFVWPFSWFPIDRDETAFFCSELMVTLLHKGGEAMDLQACTTSPNSLWDYMTTSPIMADKVCISFNRNAAAHSILSALVIPPPVPRKGVFFVPLSSTTKQPPPSS